MKAGLSLIFFDQPINSILYNPNIRIISRKAICEKYFFLLPTELKLLLQQNSPYSLKQRGLLSPVAVALIKGFYANSCIKTELSVRPVDFFPVYSTSRHAKQKKRENHPLFFHLLLYTFFYNLASISIYQVWFLFLHGIDTIAWLQI